jgi:uncharacterized protein YjgD (DUF1641 family)
MDLLAYSFKRKGIAHKYGNDYGRKIPLIMKETIEIDTNLEDQVKVLNDKLDIVLEELNFQRNRREQVEDLMNDVSLIGKDLFETTVNRLDKAGVEINGYDLERLVLKIARNVKTFNVLLDTIESGNDLFRDLSPVIKQIGLDLINTLHKLEEKGYFIFFRELLNILDKVITHFTVDDLKALADNIVTILETIKNLTQPDMLKAVNNAVAIYKNLDTESIKEISMLKALRMMNSKDGRRALGFIMTFLINVAKSTEQNNSNTN